MKSRVVTKRQGVEFRGFGSLRLDDPDLQRAIASRGGKAAHEYGGAHEWDKREAIAAGRKGGSVRSEKKCKLTDAQIAELRAAYRHGTSHALAARYGISRNYLSLIVNNRVRVAVIQ